MTSASNHPTAVTTDVAARIDTFAEFIATGWGLHGHTALTTMLAELYTDLAVLPTHYTPQQRSEIITEAADTTADELTTLLDDYIHREADRPPVTECGWTMHTDDRRHAITTMIASHAHDHLTWWLTTGLANFMAGHKDPDTKGRGDPQAPPAQNSRH